VVGDVLDVDRLVVSTGGKERLDSGGIVVIAMFTVVEIIGLEVDAVIAVVNNDAVDGVADCVIVELFIVVDVAEADWEL
jgi:hypothetical protein